MKPLACALLSLAAPVTLLAQEVADTARLQELVVTATGSPTPADAVVSSVTVITGQELRDRGIHFVQDALRQVPGAAVVQGGSYGGVSSFFLRGGESDYVKVLIDGVPVNQSGGVYNWGNLTTDNVERIEVLRGPGSVMYGSDAVTGVVQIFTRGGAPGFAVEGEAQGGTFGTAQGQASVLGGGERLNYSASGGRIATDGTYPFNNDYGNTVFSGALRSAPDDRTELSASARYHDTRYHFPTDFSGALVDSNQSSTEEAMALAVDAARRLSPQYELRLNLGGSRSNTGFEDTSDSPGDTLGFGFASEREGRAQRGKAELRLNARVSPTLTLTGGGALEQESERQSGETTSNFGTIETSPDTPFDRSRTTAGFYLQGVLDLPSGLAVNLNARVDHNSGFGSFFTFRAGTAYRLRPGTRVRAAVGRAFKAPTFCEQYCNAPFVVGDSGLQPERSTSWEVGLEQDLLSGQLGAWATYFDQQFRDMILYDGSAAPGEATYFNGAAAVARGIEAGLRSSLGPGFEANVSYTYLFAEATEDAGMPSATFATGERLIRRPSHSAELGVTARPWDRLSLGGSVAVVGSREDVDFNQFPSVRVSLPTYALVSLAGEVQVVRNLSAVARVENLLDEQYDEVVGFPGRPRAFFGGARFRF